MTNSIPTMNASNSVVASEAPPLAKREAFTLEELQERKSVLKRERDNARLVLRKCVRPLAFDHGGALTSILEQTRHLREIVDNFYLTGKLPETIRPTPLDFAAQLITLRNQYKHAYEAIAAAMVAEVHVVNIKHEIQCVKDLQTDPDMKNLGKVKTEKVKSKKEKKSKKK